MSTARVRRHPKPGGARLVHSLALLLFAASASAASAAAPLTGPAPPPLTTAAPPRRTRLQSEGGDARADNRPLRSSSSTGASGRSDSTTTTTTNGRTLPLAGAPASGSRRDGTGFTADGFPFGFGGAGPINLGPRGFGPQIYETVFGSNLNTGFVSSVSQAVPNLAGVDAGGPLRDALFALLPSPGVRAALGADVVSLVGYDAADRLLAQLVGTLGSGASEGERVPAGCIGPIFTVSLSSGECTVADGGGGGEEGGAAAAASADAAASITTTPAAKVTCTPPTASFIATPLTCNLPYRSASSLSGPSLGGAAFPLAPARSIDLVGAPLAFGAGAALNVTRLYLGYSAGTRRLLNDLGVYRWYNYAGQVAAAELLRIQAAIVTGATPALRTTSGGRLTRGGGIGGFGRGGVGGLAGIGLAMQGLRPRAAALNGSAEAEAAAVRRQLLLRRMEREAASLPPLLRSVAAAMAGTVAATTAREGGSSAVAGAREVAEAADELGRRIAARLGAASGGGEGSGVALLSALARADLAGVRQALGRSSAQRRLLQSAVEAAAAAKRGGEGGGGAAAQPALQRPPDEEQPEQLPPSSSSSYMTAAEQQALLMGNKGKERSGNPYRRHEAEAAGEGAVDGIARTREALAAAAAEREAASAAAAKAAGAPVPAPSSPPPLRSAAERAQSALDPMLVSSEDVGADVIRAIMELSAPSGADGGEEPSKPASLRGAADAEKQDEGNDLLASEGGDLAAAVAAETARGAAPESGGVGGAVSGSDSASGGERRRRRRR